MLCQKCQTNQASVHMQQFMHGQKVELHLCQECAFKIDNPEMLVSLENIFKGFLDQLTAQHFPQGAMPSGAAAGATDKIKAKRSPVKACARCGMTFHKFKTGGRLGCDVCYKSFKTEVEVLLKNVQGSTRHEGKYPRRMGAGIFNKRQVTDLRDKLKKAIELEDFENAARIRDEIRALETANNSETGSVMTE
ncbi:MAG: UvrB/UvrC motif-containing protein [Defluviitaleaceae bacterium]|nr:UvrB/UvrC motif-containing protein [Defluviitaleaceae bacterium]